MNATRSPIFGPQKPTFAAMFLVSAILFCIHANVPLPVGPGVIPQGAALLLAVVLTFARGQKVSLKIVGTIMLILAIGLIATFTGPKGAFEQRLSTTAYFVAAIFTGTVLYLELRTWPVADLRRIFLAVALVLIAGAFLEQMTPLKLLSDAFRNAIRSTGVYAGDMRDLLDTGIIRPKFFATEPSVLARSIGIASLAWLVTAFEDRLRIVKFSCLILAGLIAVRSPSLLVFYPPGVFYAYLANQPGLPNRRIGSRLLLMLVAGVAGTLVLYFIANMVMGARLANMLNGTDHSMLVRIVVPPLLTYKILNQYPLFGMGLGGKNFVAGLTQFAILEAGADVYHFTSGGDTQLFPISSLEYLATFGLLGTAMTLYLWRRIQITFAPGDGLALLVAVLCVGMAGDYIGGTYFWTFLSTLVAAGYARWRDADQVWAQARQRRHARAERYVLDALANATAPPSTAG